MKIARVFPTKTSMCPNDTDVYFDVPFFPEFMPKYDEVHISCQFTWDIYKARRLANDWKNHGLVKIGGVAIDGETEKPFTAGMYLKKGITITSRGCPNNCGFCYVRRGLIEFDDFPEGNIIQDNNILACSDHHWRLVVSMLKKQKGIMFKGGLESQRITQKVAEDLRSLRIAELWLACDYPAALKPLRKAVEILKSVGFTQNHLHCFALIGKNIDEEEMRLQEIWNIGCMPFAQLYRNKENSLKYPWAFKRFARTWSKPAIIRTRAKHNWPKWI